MVFGAAWRSAASDGLEVRRTRCADGLEVRRTDARDGLEVRRTYVRDGLEVRRTLILGADGGEQADFAAGAVYFD